MKTLAAAEADFIGREGNILLDFWSSDVLGLYQLRWERRDRRDPDFMGRETLNLELKSREVGRVYDVPGPGLTLSYSMESPTLRQGARAVELRGQVRVVEDGVELNLRARMERTDLPGVYFDENLTGTYALN